MAVRDLATREVVELRRRIVDYERIEAEAPVHRIEARDRAVHLEQPAGGLLLDARSGDTAVRHHQPADLDDVAGLKARERSRLDVVVEGGIGPDPDRLPEHHQDAGGGVDALHRPFHVVVERHAGRGAGRQVVVETARDPHDVADPQVALDARGVVHGDRRAARRIVHPVHEHASEVRDRADRGTGPHDSASRRRVVAALSPGAAAAGGEGEQGQGRGQREYGFHDQSPSGSCPSMA